MGNAGNSIPRHEVRRYAPGQSVEHISRGDFLLTHGNEWSSALIRVGQGLRYRGDAKKFAHWSHAALFADEDGTIIEAVESGVQQRNVSVYHDTEYHVVHLTEASAADRTYAVAFARHCMGDLYGFLTDLSLCGTLLTGSKFFFGLDGQIICSGLVARALERTGAIFQYDPWNMLPADLAEAFNVTSVPGASRGTVPGTGAGFPRRHL